MTRIYQSEAHELVPKGYDMPNLYEQDGAENPVVFLKWFCPWGAMTWYITEYDPESGRAFGFVTNGKDSPDNEWGYVDRWEVEEVTALGLHIERDLYFSPKGIKECLQ